MNVALMGRGTDRQGNRRLSAVRNGAYLAGELRADATMSVSYDYRHKAREIFAHAVYGPTGWTGEQLWARCEQREKGDDALFGRRIIQDIPCQISDDAKIGLAFQFAADLRRDFGVAVEVSIHLPPKDGSGKNWHMHLGTTDRPVDDSGHWARSKVRAWNTGKSRRQTLFAWRAKWERMCNEALAAANQSDRVSLQNFKTRGINVTPQRHRGIRRTDQSQRKQKHARHHEQRNRTDQRRIAGFVGAIQAADRALESSQHALEVAAFCRARRQSHTAAALRRKHGHVHPERSFHRGAALGGRSETYQSTDALRSLEGDGGRTSSNRPPRTGSRLGQTSSNRETVDRGARTPGVAYDASDLETLDRAAIEADLPGILRAFGWQAVCGEDAWERRVLTDAEGSRRIAIVRHPEDGRWQWWDTSVKIVSNIVDAIRQLIGFQLLREIIDFLRYALDTPPGPLPVLETEIQGAASKRINPLIAAGQPHIWEEIDDERPAQAAKLDETDVSPAPERSTEIGDTSWIQTAEASHEEPSRPQDSHNEAASKAAPASSRKTGRRRR